MRSECQGEKNSSSCDDRTKNLEKSALGEPPPAVGVRAGAAGLLRSWSAACSRMVQETGKELWRDEKSLDRPTVRTLPTSPSAPVQTAPWHGLPFPRPGSGPARGKRVDAART